MLKTKNLTAGYGGGPNIIHDIDIEVKESQIVTIIGPNGAGKSTVLRSIFGLTTVEPKSDVNFMQKNLVGVATSEIANLGISYVPQGRSLFTTMTVQENLEMGAYIRSNKSELKANLEYVYDKFPILYERRDQKSKLLSGGEQQMVAFGRALMLKPSLLLLDEPSIGLAPKIVADIFEKIIKIKEDGTSILMVEQNANMALAISDFAYVLELGKNKFSGVGLELIKDDRISEAYLGKKRSP